MSSLSAAAVSPRGRSLGALCAPAIAAVSLLGLVASSLTVVLIAAERPSFLAPVTRPGFFPAWMIGPLRGLWPGLTANPSRLAWLVSGLTALMFGLYLAAFITAPRLRARWTIAAVLAIHVIFLLAPPLSYTDVFNYVNYGRMGVAHDLNPYVTLPASGPHGDPSFALSNWHHLRSPYGPLFTLVSYALVPLGVKASLWALKLLVCGASLATLGLVWRCARLLGRSPVAAVAFVAFNPIVLIWALGADHNDALMMLFVVLAVYLALRQRPRPSWGWAGSALVTAIFVKASAAVLLPVLLVAAAARRRFLAGALLAAVVLALASLFAFGFHLPDLVTQGRLVTAIGIPNLIGLALGQGGETGTAAVRRRCARGARRARLRDLGRPAPPGVDHRVRVRDARAGRLAQLGRPLVRALDPAVRGLVGRAVAARRHHRARGVPDPGVHAGGRAARRRHRLPSRGDPAGGRAHAGDRERVSLRRA